MRRAGSTSHPTAIHCFFAIRRQSSSQQQRCLAAWPRSALLMSAAMQRARLRRHLFDLYRCQGMTTATNCALFINRIRSMNRVPLARQGREDSVLCGSAWAESSVTQVRTIMWTNGGTNRRMCMTQSEAQHWTVYRRCTSIWTVPYRVHL
jgi:hypothetical protein